MAKLQTLKYKMEFINAKIAKHKALYILDRVLGMIFAIPVFIVSLIIDVVVRKTRR